MWKWIIFSAVYLMLVPAGLFELFSGVGYVLDFEKNTFVLSNSALSIGSATLSISISVVGLYFIIHGGENKRKALALRLRLKRLAQKRRYWNYQELCEAACAGFRVWTEAERFGRPIEATVLMTDKLLDDCNRLLIMRRADGIPVDNKSELMITGCKIVEFNDSWPQLETFEALVEGNIAHADGIYELETMCMFIRRDSFWLMTAVYETESARVAKKPTG